ncbi:fimbria/pilus outer membrane usher protein [Pseudomonas sp. MDT2-39-1]
MLLIAIFARVNAQELEFDSGFVRDFDHSSGTSNVDIAAMLKERDIGPGRYVVGITINQEYFGQREISFTRLRQDLMPCLSPTLLTEMGVKTAVLLDATQQSVTCVDLQSLVKESSIHFNSQKLLLDISVPQIAMERDARGYVSPKEWDSGINASFLNYQLSGSQSKNQQQTATGYNLYLNGGMNLGDWRLRSSSSYRKSGQWEHATTYVQRDLPGTAGTLSLGESVTPGDMFQSIPFRGVQLSTDVDMLPDSLQGYAPIIHGIAQTQAKVEIRQHGYSLYTTYVAPGPFEIRDLNAATGSGDLEVIITEADGTERRFIQPYATLGNLLRQGTWRYSVTAGQYNENNENSDRPTFTQASFAYGLPSDYTLSVGGLFSDAYRAWQMGVGKGLGSLGAISLDATQATTDTARGTLSGQSYGIRYGKAFDSGTSIRFAGYRYSTQGYRDFGEAVFQRNANYDALDAYQGISRRSRLEANISQSLDSRASIYLNLTQQDYWGSSRQERQLQFGVNTQISKVNVGLYASKSLSDSDYQGAQIGLTFTFPLGQQSASVSLNRNTDGSNDQRLGMSGMAGQYNDVNYNVDMLRSETSANTGSASVGYRAPWAQLSGGASNSRDYKSANIGMSGSVLAHAGGIELGQSMGETMALVEVKDTPNVGVNNAPGSLTNSKGYSLVPYVQPYRKNRISLDTSQLDTNTDIDNGVKTVIPRRGAVVLARFDASHSQKVLATVRLKNGVFVPFGAAVLDEKGRKVNVIGLGGQVLLAVADSHKFQVEWGASQAQHCSLDIDFEETEDDGDFKVVNAYCN